ncbi:hypothetical protein ACVIHH_008232 [Bradyrhizobium sp. USDA 4518]
MSRIACFLLAAQILCFGSAAAQAGSPLCLAGCVHADVDGLKDVADALKQWAHLLPGLNERFHENVREDLRAMDAVAANLVDRLDRTYGKNLDLTNVVVKQLMAEATKQIDEIGNQALDKYKQALFTTNCVVESMVDIVQDKIEESIPRFQRIRSFFGEKFNVLKTTDFHGKPIVVTFDPDSRTDRFQATYKLLTLKLESADAETKLESPLAVALDRQRLAYSYYCAARPSLGGPDGVGHVYVALQAARQEYLALNRLVQDGLR